MNQASVNTIVPLVRSRLNLTNLNTISDAEIKVFIRSSMAQLYEIICNRHKDYYISIYSLTMLANQGKYPLPSDFRSSSQLYLLSGSAPNIRRSPMREFTTEEYQTLTSYTYLCDKPVMYRIMGREVWVTPAPSADGQVIEMLYTPQFKAPVNDDAPIDSVLPNGWERWVEFDACAQIAMRMRLAEYYAMYSKERDTVEGRIIKATAIRDEQAHYMTDAFGYE